jgi:hypothetical protein
MAVGHRKLAPFQELLRDPSGNEAVNHCGVLTAPSVGGPKVRTLRGSMQTLVLTPREVFYLPQRLLVPLFQRAYVWSREAQWVLLWDDIRRKAEGRLNGSSEVTPHFLGAVVLQDMSAPPGQLSRRTIIDGQQRLTTLQVALDAAHGVMIASGQDKLARQLDRLTFNPEEFWADDADRFKVWPTNRDRTAYNEVMAAELPMDYQSLQHAESRIVQAHSFFAGVFGDWVQEDGHDSARRSEVLVQVLTTGLQMVVIELRADEDSQEIFETLNARGTPLTAADLIKNFVFQRLALERAEAEKAYQEHWSLFETPFWESQTSVGRYLLSRSSLFLNQWLIARTGEEVGPRATFSRFKHYVEQDMSLPMAELLPTLHREALQYQRWVETAADPHAQLGSVELFVYRTQALDSEIVKPILLWLHDPSGPSIPTKERDRALAAVESWLVRRALLRLTTADYGRVVADLIKTHRGSDPSTLGQRVTAYLSQQDRASSYWPGDDEIRQAMRDFPAYRRYKRARLRMVLEAVEDHARSYTRGKPSPTGSRVQRGVLHIEHLLPQQWQTNWPVEGLEARVVRQDHVHLLGNLTLLTESLNSSVSNGPWLGENGKLAALEKHDVILLNRKVRKLGASGWNEKKIDIRSGRMIEAILETWPVPPGHTGEIREDSDVESTWIELKDLMQAGLLRKGTKLHAPSGMNIDSLGTVLPGGRIEADGKVFDSPSGAAKHLKGRTANGWRFWRLPDGRRLEDLRIEFRQGSGV